jgi:hypothetical protein
MFSNSLLLEASLHALYSFQAKIPSVVTSTAWGKEALIFAVQRI